MREYLWVEESQNITISDDEKCYLIGFCVDIHNPSAQLKEITNNLSECLYKSEEEFYAYNETLCGRYVIIYKPEHDGWRIITDATGFRPVYHDEKATVITSHAKLCAVNRKKEHFDYDTRIPRNFNLKGNRRYTQFENVFHLNPNASLAYGTGDITRIFPRKSLISRSKKEVISNLILLVGNALKGLVTNQEKLLLLGLTAGYDSRMTLSIMLQNGIRPELCFTCNRGEVLTKDVADNQIAKVICKKLKLQHFSAIPAIEVEKDLKKALKSNSIFRCVGLFDTMVAGLIKIFPDDQYINVNSNICEIWRRYNFKNKRGLVKFPNFSDKDFVDYGLHEENTFNYQKGALLYWEHSLSRRILDGYLQSDAVYDTFNPYNAREIINLMLSFPKDFIAMQEIHETLIKELDSYF